MKLVKSPKAPFFTLFFLLPFVNLKNVQASKSFDFSRCSRIIDPLIQQLAKSPNRKIALAFEVFAKLDTINKSFRKNYFERISQALSREEKKTLVQDYLEFSYEYRTKVFQILEDIEKVDPLTLSKKNQKKYKTLIEALAKARFFLENTNETSPN